MSRTRTQLRQQTVQQLGLPVLTGTSDSSGGAVGAMRDVGVLDTYGDNRFIGAWLYFSDGSPVPDTVYVTDSTSSNGQLSYRPNTAAAPNSEPYEILPFKPEAVHEAINEALNDCYLKGQLAREVINVHHVAGSPIYNANMEYWDGFTDLHGWSRTNLSTTRADQSTGGGSVEYTDGRFGDAAVKFITAAGTFSLDREFRQYLSNFSGTSPVLRASVWSDTVTDIRAQLLGDGVVLGSTDYNSVAEKWQVVSSSSIDIPSTVTEIGVQFEWLKGGGGGTTAAASAIWLENGPIIREYPFPNAGEQGATPYMPQGPDSIYTVPIDLQETDKRVVGSARRLTLVNGWAYYREYPATYHGGDGSHGILMFHDDLPRQGEKLWMPSRAPFNLPTSNSARVEIDVPNDLLVTKKAALMLLQRHPAVATSPRMLTRAAELRQEIQEILDEGRGGDKGWAPIAADF